METIRKATRLVFHQGHRSKLDSDRVAGFLECKQNSKHEGVWVNFEIWQKKTAVVSKLVFKTKPSSCVLSSTFSIIFTALNLGPYIQLIWSLHSLYWSLA